MATAGYFDTTFFGDPVTVALLATKLQQQCVIYENQSILSEDNQGDNSPQALSKELLAFAQDYINQVAIFQPPVPDADMSTAVPFAQRILFEAGFVPISQWSAATFNPALPNSIAAAMAAAQSAATPPVPPASPVKVGTCYGNVCAPGPGSSFNNTVDGQIVTNPDGSQYVAHVTSLIGMPQLWFSPVVKGS